MFSWSGSIPFAIVKDGDLDGKVLYYSDNNKSEYNYESEDEQEKTSSDNEDNDQDQDEYEDQYEDEENEENDEKGETVKEYNKRKNKEKKATKKKVTKKKKPIRKEKKSFDHIVLNYPSHFLYIPPGNKRMSYYLGGPNGSGKSFLVSQIVKTTKEMHPGFEFYLFSLKDKDPVLDKRDPVRVLLDDTLLNDPIDPTEISNSIAVFDDIDSIPDKDIKTCVYDIRKNILNVGRSANVHCLCTNHMLCNSNETKTMLNECNIVVFFPAATPVRQSTNYLKNYLGCSKAMSDYILSLGKDQVEDGKDIKKGSRYIMTFKDAPQHILTENECFSMAFMNSVVESSGKRKRKAK